MASVIVRQLAWAIKSGGGAEHGGHGGLQQEGSGRTRLVTAVALIGLLLWTGGDLRRRTAYL